MNEVYSISGRDVRIFIDGKEIITAEKAEVRKTSEIYSVRSCFCSEDKALIRKKSRYKANIMGLKLKSPFENNNFADMDNFEMQMKFDSITLKLHGCMWDDFLAAADMKKFCEHISVIALKMDMEAEE